MSTHAEMRAEAAKTMKGHKGRLRIAFYYVCECGWQGAQALGRGARSAAAHEFQSHKVRCIEEWESKQ